MRRFRKKRRNGFTLIELILVLLCIGILATIIFVALNPLKQINKSYDLQRVKDLNTIQTTLDTYYNDHNCYPPSIPLGSAWIDGSSILSPKLPQDPQLMTNGSYVYLTDTTNSCPQWNVTFSKLTNAPTNTNTCSLSSNCLPSGYTTQWACKVSGTPDCQALAAKTLPQTFASAQSSSTSNITSTNGTTNIKLCHYNSVNNYTLITTAPSSNLAGHDGHSDDIIPPFSYSCYLIGTCQYPGKNWTQDNQITYNNGCVVYSNPSTNADCKYPIVYTSYQKTCTVDTDQILNNFTNYFPTGKGQMIANLYNDWSVFAISNPSFAPQPYVQTSTLSSVRWGTYYYWLDVSINPDFSGQTCDALVCAKQYNTSEVGDDCQTVLSYGIGTLYSLQVNNSPLTAIIGYHFDDEGTSTGGMTTTGIFPPDSDFWKYYRSGQKIYWRYRSIYPADNGKTSPTSEAVVNQCIPSKRFTPKDATNPYWMVFHDTVTSPYPMISDSDNVIIQALNLLDLDQ